MNVVIVCEDSFDTECMKGCNLPKADNACKLRSDADTETKFNEASRTGMIRSLVTAVGPCMAVTAGRLICSPLFTK